MSTLNAFSLSDCCCGSCKIIEQGETNGGDAINWDLDNWTQDAGTWTVAGGGTSLQTTSSNAILSCNIPYPANDKFAGPHILAKIVGGSPGDGFYVWYDSGGYIVKWRVVIGEKVELDYDGTIGVEYHADPTIHATEVSTYAGLTVVDAFDVPNECTIGMQQCLYDEAGSYSFARLFCLTQYCLVVAEPEFLVAPHSPIGAGAWGIGTDTISSTLTINYLWAYKPSERNDIDYWFDWATTAQPEEVSFPPRYDTQGYYGDFVYRNTAAPSHCNTSGPRFRQVLDPDHPIMPREWTIVPTSGSMWPSGSPCNSLGGASVLTLQGQDADIDVISTSWSSWVHTSTFDGYSVWSTYDSGSGDYLANEAKTVYKLTVWPTVGDDTKMTINLYIRTYQESEGDVEHAISYRLDIDRYTDLTTVTDLELPFYVESTYANCMNTAGDSFDWNDTSFKITATA